MDEITIDFRPDIAKLNAAYAETVRVPEAMRAELATAVAAERARLGAELIKPAPVPVPRRQRRRSLASTLKAARKAGADRVEYGGAMSHLNGESQPQAANGDAAGAPERNPWEEKYGDDGV